MVAGCFACEWGVAPTIEDDMALCHRHWLEAEQADNAQRRPDPQDAGQEIRAEHLRRYSHTAVRDRYDADLLMAGFADGAKWATDRTDGSSDGPR